MDTATWQAANQSALLAALRPVYTALLRHVGQSEPSDLGAATTAGLEPPAAIERITDIFRLSAFERAVLLLCAGVELDSRFAEACAPAHGDPRKGHATFGLAIATLADAHWSALSRDRPLRRMRLVELPSGETLASAPLRIDERILHFLAGVESSDERLDGLITAMPAALPAPPPGWLANAAEHAACALAAPGGRVLLTGRSAGDRALAAAAALRGNGLRPCVLQTADISAAAVERMALARAWTREARLAQAGLCVQLADPVEARPLLGLLAEIDVPVLLEGDEAVVPAGLDALRLASRRHRRQSGALFGLTASVRLAAHQRRDRCRRRSIRP